MSDQESAATGEESPGPFYAGQTVIFEGNIYTRGGRYARSITQEEADRFNAEYAARQAEKG
ncbi:hypothetical protein ACFY4C_40205 [Actinomadura viridis]|uniref:hypothetical protein n=1 Tax=Actinomadura viridis TaxID=58110 RepID=UPI0036A28169